MCLPLAWMGRSVYPGLSLDGAECVSCLTRTIPGWGRVCVLPHQDYPRMGKSVCPASPGLSLDGAEGVCLGLVYLDSGLY